MNTLKDIEKDYSDELVIFVDKRGEFPPMLEVKCDKCGNTNNFSWKNDEEFTQWYNRKLRESAKEWVDKITENWSDMDKKSIPHIDLNENGFGWYVQEYTNEDNQMLAGIVGWINTFFNLEE